jgi:hypothetical protein
LRQKVAQQQQQQQQCESIVVTARKKEIGLLSFGRSPQKLGLIAFVMVVLSKENKICLH